MEFVRQSRDAAKRQAALQQEIKRFVGMDEADPNARYAVNDIGMRHGLSRYDEVLGKGRNISSIQAWMRGAQAEGQALRAGGHGVQTDGRGAFADDTLLYGLGLPWREMSVADFDSLAGTVREIVAVEGGRRAGGAAAGAAEKLTHPLAGQPASRPAGRPAPQAASHLTGQPVPQAAGGKAGAAVTAEGSITAGGAVESVGAGASAETKAALAKNRTHSR